MSDLQQVLKDLKPSKEFFIGIDSDGCALDSMEIKQKECFCPNNVKFYGLQAVSKYAREATEFVNLYSKGRGLNRFPAILAVIDLLRERKEVKARGVKVPELKRLRQWIKEETKLGNGTLKKKVEQTNDPELKLVYQWSEAVNAAIEDIVKGVPPFPFVAESLEKAAKKADLIVVSQTPVEAIRREWHEHGIDKHLRAIAGQEHGTKSEHLILAAKGKYPAEKTLMIGDALGDLKAARDAGTLFYPIIPGREEASWKTFYDTALDRFFAGTYKGAYEEGLILELDKALPEKPGW
jgi:phosphoglycolate phosphatase-like HAD superfamily hydrolase